MMQVPCARYPRSHGRAWRATGGAIGIFWSSPGYCHCCFTARNDLDAGTSQMITDAFVSMDYKDPLGKTAMDAERCKAFIPGITHGWEMLERVAQEEGLI